ncbi:hypothetical protein FB45DRAFT_923051 [Roridomyces roridus]|uniref:MYND-type domain-containing protein n=1 Tax=Roridomyces roridus TaxID=1738132 RepID=A0AAD7BNK6_9AGAR|nr:hypothetical protein FB45DRAFT_923051 [Roridomyces roridus]
MEALGLVILPKTEMIGLLPIVYVHTDPSLIPSSDALDLDTFADPPTTPSPPKSIKFAVANFMLLASIVDHNPHFPVDVIPELWSRMWGWMELILAYSDCTAAARPNSCEMLNIQGSLCQIIREFSRHDTSNAVIFVTPGVHRMLAAAWASIIPKLPNPHNPDAVYLATLPLLAMTFNTETSDDLAEIIEGCGGSITDLAKLSLDTLSIIASNPEWDIGPGVLPEVFKFLDSIHSLDHAVAETLQRSGLVPALVRTLGVTGPPPSPLESLGGLPTPTKLCAIWLIISLDTTPGHPCFWTIRALRAGLLGYLLYWARRLENAPTPELGELVGIVLPSTLIFRSAIVQMQRSLLEVETESRSDQFIRSSLYPTWVALQSCFDERAELLEAWEASGRVSFVECYNSQCNKINQTKSFRRCASCRTAVYCSKACQVADWRGGHRDECTPLYAQYIELSRILPKHRDRSFLRVLLDSDYRRLQVEIGVKMVQCLSNTLFTAADLCVVFNYADVTGVQTSVYHVPVDIPLLHHSRCLRSQGRLTLHMMRIPHERSATGVPFPLHSASSQFNDGLLRIASRVGVDALRDGRVDVLVRELIDSIDEEYLPFH